MKPSKLPTARIPNTYETQKISPKRLLVVFFITLAIMSIVVLLYAVIVSYQQNVFLQSKTESMMISPHQDSVLVNATAKIISREGNVPFPTAKKYAMWIYESGATYGVDPLLVLSVMGVESKFNYRAISPTGPIGLLQVAWSWHKDKSTKDALFDPKTNIFVGTQIIKEYRNLSSSETELLLRYNGSLGSFSPQYAIKVLTNKSKFEKEIMTAVADSI
jgi:soluble lytic murein transglycosylase-like protein